jgi:hypothetical protein
MKIRVSYAQASFRNPNFTIFNIKVREPKNCDESTSASQEFFLEGEPTFLTPFLISKTQLCPEGSFDPRSESG